MENPEAKPSRQSAIHSIINREIEHITIDRQPPAATMAATAVITPTSANYTHPPPPYSSGWPTSSLSGLISPPDSRRTSDHKTAPPPPIPASQSQPQPQRQSLPSIHEALSSGSKATAYASPVSASAPPHPSPYPPGPPMPRAHPPPDHTRYATPPVAAPPRPTSPPQPPPHPTPFARPDPAAFPDPPRHPSTSAPPPAPASHHPYSAPRYEPVRYEQDHRSQDRGPPAYPQHPPPQPQPPYAYGPPPSRAAPPGPPGPVFSQPQYEPRDPRDPRDAEARWAREAKSEPSNHFQQGLKRHLEVYTFEDNLAKINKLSSNIATWSAHYNAILGEQQPSASLVPDRMPNLESIDDMIRTQDALSNALQEMRGVIFEQAQNTAQQRMHMMRPPGEYDEDVMFGDEMKGHAYGSESKKRRGRAAPPGRCHSCNRAETPEWRRGPDGARTLCNACGLHYAKLTRKNTLKTQNGPLRPKSMDDLSPRPHA